MFLYFLDHFRSVVFLPCSCLCFLLYLLFIYLLASARCSCVFLFLPSPQCPCFAFFLFIFTAPIFLLPSSCLLPFLAFPQCSMLVLSSFCIFQSMLLCGVHVPALFLLFIPIPASVLCPCLRGSRLAEKRDTRHGRAREFHPQHYVSSQAATPPPPPTALPLSPTHSPLTLLFRKHHTRRPQKTHLPKHSRYLTMSKVPVYVCLWECV